MLTLNAEMRPIFKELHRRRPQELQDKRMVAILPRGLYAAWLMRPTPAAWNLCGSSQRLDCCRSRSQSRVAGKIVW
ncbi:hypothetical protein [Xylophilus rhododendri]|uniref:hypothetical protein n=1 Tax=Xylophilus rhododendri TaxID=2697032 RepID=UPI0018A26850|nr:hypothetical protein [Xylophilus rhododendri]